MHTVNTCCGQFGKRENNSNFISGYKCKVCWSTKDGTDCPCPVSERILPDPGDIGFSTGKTSFHVTGQVSTVSKNKHGAPNKKHVAKINNCH